MFVPFDLKTINNIQIDSRKVQSNDVFVCLAGEYTDGHKYIDSAYNNGAKYIVCEYIPEENQQLFRQFPDIFVQVPNSSIALADIAYTKCRKNIEQCQLIGITGTNGKTSVSYFAAQLLSSVQDQPVGIIGTNGSYIWQQGKQLDEYNNSTQHTTPFAHELFEIINNMSLAGCRYIVMEVSSHALVQYRVHNLQFKIACWTNFTQDHLDYHLTMDNYFQAKKLLFDNLDNKSTAITNKDDKALLTLVHTNLHTYRINNNQADLFINNIQTVLNTQNPHTTGIINNSLPVSTNILGHFSISNLLASISIVKSLSYKLEDILKHTKVLQPPAGRFQIITSPVQYNLPTCIIDYAHTPDGLLNVLNNARTLMPQDSIQSKLICIFGAGGDRDTSKRSIMGKISEENADHIILTNDNPRTEDPQQIIADIISGINNPNAIEIIYDRTIAIENAMSKYNNNDIIVIAGKGHEDYQILKDSTIYHSDIDSVNNYIERVKQDNDVAL